ncbi:hypothetical protein [Arthrobacter mobilis]|uniref:Uncharacterized protein n=1 Tax=Arthrobacter mobilis TaxID=2724944 RepID=A0A7X6K680_9MICC|nr:hypothetical protein [Arthrobacter mobilis]NKX55299.1 hypothetical protein [Arthrobacter mobilis]
MPKENQPSHGSPDQAPPPDGYPVKEWKGIKMMAGGHVVAIPTDDFVNGFNAVIETTEAPAAIAPIDTGTAEEVLHDYARAHDVRDVIGTDVSALIVTGPEEIWLAGPQFTRQIAAGLAQDPEFLDGIRQIRGDNLGQ